MGRSHKPDTLDIYSFESVMVDGKHNSSDRHWVTHHQTRHLLLKHQNREAQETCPEETMKHEQRKVSACCSNGGTLSWQSGALGGAYTI